MHFIEERGGLLFHSLLSLSKQIFKEIHILIPIGLLYRELHFLYYFETGFSTRCCCLLLLALPGFSRQLKIVVTKERYTMLLSFMSLLEATWTFRCVMVL